MSDPRLNSVHLEPPRRQVYRQAREGLLRARGSHTLAVELKGEDESGAGMHTLVQAPGKQLPSGVKFWLVDAEFVYPLQVGLNTVGRSSDNDVIIHDAFISRRHCAILVHAGEGCELHDTASKNGTYLNGARLSKPTRLRPGDTIRMCDRELTFMSKEEPCDGPQTRTLCE